MVTVHIVTMAASNGNISVALENLNLGDSIINATATDASGNNYSDNCQIKTVSQNVTANSH
jgi:hypothetical protein